MKVQVSFSKLLSHVDVPPSNSSPSSPAAKISSNRSRVHTLTAAPRSLFLYHNGKVGRNTGRLTLEPWNPLQNLYLTVIETAGTLSQIRRRVASNLEECVRLWQIGNKLVQPVVLALKYALCRFCSSKWRRFSREWRVLIRDSRSRPAPFCSSERSSRWNGCRFDGREEFSYWLFPEVDRTVTSSF